MMADKALIYIHGQGGNAGDSEYFKPLFPEYDVLGFDYASDKPWDAVPEYKEYFDSCWGSAPESLFRITYS